MEIIENMFSIFVSNGYCFNLAKLLITNTLLKNMIFKHKINTYLDAIFPQSNGLSAAELERFFIEWEIRRIPCIFFLNRIPYMNNNKYKKSFFLLRSHHNFAYTFSKNLESIRLKLTLLQSSIVFKSGFSAYLHSLPQKLFNKTIKDEFHEKESKQTWLAEKLDKSFNIVNDYCNNRIQLSLDVINKISEILEVKNIELLKSSKK